MHDHSTRRRFLRRSGAALALGLAGCLGTDRPATEPPEATGSPSSGTGTPASPTGSPSGTGTDTPPSEEGGPVAWRRDLGSAVTHPPATRGGTAFVGTEAGTVHAVATGDGRRRWSTDVGQPVQSRPLVADGAAFVVSGTTELGSNHEVYALETDTGEERWRFAPESWWLEPVGTHEGTLYVATADDAISAEGQTLYALATEGGEERWSAEVGDASGGLVTDEAVYVPSYGRLYAYDAGDGTRRWTRELADYTHRTIVATEDRVVYAAETDGSRGELVGLDAATGERAWSFGDWFVTSTTLAGGALYAGGEHVAAFDPATGERRWQTDGSGFLPHVPVNDGTLYAGGDGVRAIAVEDGTVRWEWTPDTAVQGTIPAALTGGRLFVDSFREADPRNRYKFAMDSGTGDGRFTFDGGTELTDVTAGDGYALVGGEDGSVYALETE